MAQSGLLVSKRNERQEIVYKEEKSALIFCSVCRKRYFILPCGKRWEWREVRGRSFPFFFIASGKVQLFIALWNTRL